jgi:hypothetical protein
VIDRVSENLGEAYNLVLIFAMSFLVVLVGSFTLKREYKKNGRFYYCMTNNLLSAISQINFHSAKLTF